MNPVDNAKRLLEMMEESSRSSGRTPSHSELALALGDMVHAYEELQALINSPQIADFAEALKLEALHQRQRWDDSTKQDADWGMLIMYLSSKAHYNPVHPNDSYIEKKLHRIITIGAAAMNWFAAVKDRHGTRDVPAAGTLPALQEQGDRDGHRTGHDEG